VDSCVSDRGQILLLGLRQLKCADLLIDRNWCATRRGGEAPHSNARTVRHPGCAVSQWIRKQVEEALGWMKTIGGLRKTRYRGRERVQMHAYLSRPGANSEQ